MKQTTLKFTTRWVTSARVPPDYPDDRIDFWDTGRRGLGLRVNRKTGSKVYFVMYRYQGVQRRLALGSVEIVVMGEDGLATAKAGMSLAEARKRADILFGMLARGIDPRPAAAPPAPDGDTFSKLAQLFIEGAKKTKRPRTAIEYARQINAYLMPAWAPRIASSLTRADVKTVIGAIEQRGSTVMANRTAALVGAMFGWWIKEGLLAINPATKLDRTPETPPKRILSDPEIRELWLALNRQPGQVAAYFRICLLTGQRRSEVAGMVWSEVDMEEAQWRLPAARTKANRGHAVPLVGEAWAIVQALRKAAAPDDTRVFTDLGSLSGVIKRLQAAGVNPRPHDLRRTASSLMARAGVTEFDIGCVLNHAKPGMASKHYIKHDYQNEKARALRRLDGAVKAIVEGRDHRGDKVVALHAS